LEAETKKVKRLKETSRILFYTHCEPARFEPKLTEQKLLDNLSSIIIRTFELKNSFQSSEIFQDRDVL